ncbi:MAG TPA: alpha/beta fold hydrolase, partial [Sphingomicrobium sp.]|nr:alpha/beta fold hydrolase [Sphingomicrobium sp.]
MSVEQGPIWCAGQSSARALDRRAFLATLAAATAAPLWARGPASYPPPDRELMAPVPGGSVYVRINGRLAGPRLPVVMIHGGPGGTHSGFLNALALADERAVILYDQLDSGRSDHPNNPANWTVARFTDEVDAVRRAVGVPRWHVLGASWGGTIALEYGARRPPELAGLVLASPLVSTRSWIADANA